MNYVNNMQQTYLSNINININNYIYIYIIIHLYPKGCLIYNIQTSNNYIHK